MSHLHPKDSALIFFQCNNETVTNVYDPENEIWIQQDKNEFYAGKNENRCRRGDPRVYIRVPGRDKRPPKEVVDEYIQFADDMLDATKRHDPGRIGSVTDTALFLFKQDCRVKFEESDIDESRWLHLAHRGGIQFCRRGYEGDSWHYDYISHYPAICNSDLPFPIGKPNKIRLAPHDKIDLEIPGIYQIHILGEHPLLRLKPIDKPDQDYLYATNMDLKCAELLSVPYKFKRTSDRFNGRQYTKCVPGKDIFGTYMTYFFKYKQQGRQFAKPMLNLLTGMLCAKKHLYHSTEADAGAPLDITRMLDIEWIPGKIAYLHERKQVFKRPDLARLGIWITAYGRHKVIKFLAEHGMIDTVARIHTDGFHIVKPLSDDVLSRNMGGLKFEGKVALDVRNMLHYKQEGPDMKEDQLWE